MGLLAFIKKNLLGKKGEKKADIKTYNREFNVVGVTFKNDDNTSRQEVLENIKEKKKPFNQKLDLGIEGYTFEGEAAFAVTVNGIIIGNIPKKDLPFFEGNRERMIGFKDLYVGCVKGKYYAKVKVIIKTKDQ